MTKNGIINEVVSSLVFSLDKDQLELVKSTFIVKMQGYEIHELCTLPSTEVRDNDFIFKRFTVACVRADDKVAFVPFKLNLSAFTCGDNITGIHSDLPFIKTTKKLQCKENASRHTLLQ